MPQSLRLLRVFLASILLLPLVGCGAGNGSGSSGLAAPVEALGGLRHIGIDDTWTFDVAYGSGTKDIKTGDATITVYGLNQCGMCPIGIGEQLVFNPAGASHSSAMEKSSIVYTTPLYADSNLDFGSIQPGKLSLPAITIPTTFATGYSHTLSVDPAVYGYGIQSTSTITGKEVVTTPLGRFDAWRMTESETVTTDNENYTSSGTYWYVPQITQFVKADFTVKFSSGAVTHYVLTLNSTNVPLK